MKRSVLCMIITVSALLMALLTGCAEKTETFSSIVEAEIFADVPLMTGEEINFSEVKDVGDGNYLIWAYDTTKTDYENYLTVLEQNEFIKYVDNGEAFEGFVYTSHYLKENFLISVTHYPKMEETMITVCEEAELSERLIYSDDYVKGNKEEAKTTLTMPELWNAGSSFVFQLKNGHFIVNDGGYEEDLPYLLDYMESLVPEGEKPVVEAWIVSHSHSDHMGVFVAFSDNKKWCDRIYLDEVYYNEASEEAHDIAGEMAKASALTFYTKTVPSMFKTSNGGTPKVIRLRQGERYYYSDITMDVVYTQDLLSYDEWKTWNATSTVLMYTVEGQKILLTADADWECQMLMLEIYDDSYFDMAVYQAPHHGGNVYNEFSSHLKADTVLYPTYDVERQYAGMLNRVVQNSYLKSKSGEVLGWVEGGVVLTFPYEVGSYQRLPLTEWKYTKQEAQRMQWKK